MTSARLIGAAVLRREDDKLLRGQAVFIDDIDVPATTLHLAFVRSPYAHATIEAIDCAAALALPGVAAVVTGGELARWTKPQLQLEIIQAARHGDFRL